jgi:hypothetical protein
MCEIYLRDVITIFVNRMDYTTAEEEAPAANLENQP